MEFQLPAQLPYQAASVLALLLFLYCLVKWMRNRDTRTKPPHPSGSWPVIGHLHLLTGLPHMALGKLAENYGPIFMIKLGVHSGLVVSSPEIAKECLGGNDKVFVDRPPTIFVEHLGYNSAMLGFAPYGEYWREMRKIVTVELLSSYRLEMLRHVRISEVRTALKAIHENHQARRNPSDAYATELIEMKTWFNNITLNTSVRLIAGKSLKEFYHGEEYNRCVKAIRDFFDLGSVFVPADAIPWLRWLDIGGYEKAMKKAAAEIDHVAQGWLEEHKKRRITGQANGKQDFMDIMLDIFEKVEDKPVGHEADTIIKSTSMAMILAGTDTASVTLTWALSLLLNNRDALKKTQDELDAIVGKERQVNESDLKNLTYLQAVLKETMRLYPAAPLSVPREAVTDCTISNYHIPSRTRLFVNLYVIHRDPQVWPDPLVFRPERFLTTHKEYDVRGQNLGYMPFGSGKRICPGISFGIQVMQFTLANLIHGFDISTQSEEPVDMTEGYGLTNLKATPLEVILTPRLPNDLYKTI